jgi:hypothetical protein
MNPKKAQRALKQIAKRDSVTVEEVRREIQIAIVSAQRNPDPRVRAFWESVTRKGTTPTPEEVIAYIRANIHR